MSSFITRLEESAQASRSLLCIGLDVDVRRMPVPDVFHFNRAIIDATKDLVCAYKPNLAFYESLGLPGLKALEETVVHIRRVAPKVVVIGDAKRGDIGPSAEAYAQAMFKVWDFDAATVNPWGGSDSIEPFLTDSSRGVFIWCRGSNPGSSDFQDLRVISSQVEAPVYLHLATAAKRWSHQGNIGLVVGATQPEQLAQVRRACPDMPLLIPGIGFQGGDLQTSVLKGTDSRGRRALISASRSIVYASGGADFASAARLEAERLREAINLVLESQGKGWR